MIMGAPQALDRLQTAGQFPINELVELNKALRANARSSFAKASVGYPQQGVNFTGELAPLVPQSIQGTLDSKTFTEKHVQFWRMLYKQPVTSTLHESNVINEHGSMDLDGFFAEGGIPAQSEAEYERKIVQVKYIAERIVLTDVATMVGITGVNQKALAQRTQDGTAALLAKMERALFNADSALTPLMFDGLHKQITAGAPDNYTDLRGEGITPEKLIEILGKLVSAPLYSAPNWIFLEPQVVAALSQIAVSSGRHDELKAGGTRIVKYGTNDVVIAGPYGDVPIKPIPLMAQNQTPNTAALGGAAAPGIVLGDLTITTPVVAGGYFDAATAGDYWIKVVAVGDKGIGAPLAPVAAISVAAGDVIRIDVDDSADPTSGDASVRYYRLFVGTKGAATNADATYVGSFPRNTAGAGGGTRMEYNLARMRNTGRGYILQLDQGTMYWTQLLDFVRRPLAQVQTEVPFLLMLFGALHLKVPTKQWAIDNISFTI